MANEKPNKNQPEAAASHKAGDNANQQAQKTDNKDQQIKDQQIKDQSVGKVPEQDKGSESNDNKNEQSNEIDLKAMTMDDLKPYMERGFVKVMAQGDAMGQYKKELESLKEQKAAAIAEYDNKIKDIKHKIDHALDDVDIQAYYEGNRRMGLFATPETFLKKTGTPRAAKSRIVVTMKNGEIKEFTSYKAVLDDMGIPHNVNQSAHVELDAYLSKHADSSIKSYSTEPIN